MNDLISRQALLESIERISVKGNVLDDDWIYRFIQEFPSAQAERKTGRWIGEADGYADGGLVYDMWHCSSCDYFIEDDEEPTFHYCPNCGAKMDEEADHDDHL